MRRYFDMAVYRLADMRETALTRRRLETLRIPQGMHDHAGVTAVCLVKDASYWIDEFLRHHRSIGVGRFVFVDNGSSDATRERLLAEPDVILLGCDLPPLRYEARMRREAARRFCKGRWCLFVDADEMFEIPLAGDANINDLTRRLDSRDHTGLVAHMLDMFPDGPLSEWREADYAEAVAGFRFCNVADMVAHAYHGKDTPLHAYLATNELAAGQDPHVYTGGVRQAIFSENPFLTKHPLVKLTGKVVPARHVHISTHLRLSELSTFIRHYKFAGDVLENDRKSVAANTWDHSQDRLRVERLQARPGLSMMSPNARVYRGKEDLAAQGLITMDPSA